MLLSDLVLRRRKELGLSQVELSRRADLHQRMISDIERGVARRPNLRSLQALARELKVPLSQMVVLSGHAESEEDAKRLEQELEDQENDPYLRQILWEWRDMNDSDKRWLLEQWRSMKRWQRDVAEKFGDAEEGE